MSKSLRFQLVRTPTLCVGWFVKNNTHRQIQKFIRTRQMRLTGIKRQYIWIVKSVETNEFFSDDCKIVENMYEAKRFDDYDTARHVATTLRHYLEDEQFEVVRLDVP